MSHGHNMANAIPSSSKKGISPTQAVNHGNYSGFHYMDNSFPAHNNSFTYPNITPRMKRVNASFQNAGVIRSSQTQFPIEMESFQGFPNAIQPTQTFPFTMRQHEELVNTNYLMSIINSQAQKLQAVNPNYPHPLAASHGLHNISAQFVNDTNKEDHLYGFMRNTEFSSTRLRQNLSYDVHTDESLIEKVATNDTMVLNGKIHQKPHILDTKWKKRKGDTFGTRQKVTSSCGSAFKKINSTKKIQRRKQYTNRGHFQKIELRRKNQLARAKPSQNMLKKNKSEKKCKKTQQKSESTAHKENESPAIVRSCCKQKYSQNKELKDVQKRNSMDKRKRKVVKRLQRLDSNYKPPYYISKMLFVARLLPLRARRPPTSFGELLHWDNLIIRTIIEKKSNYKRIEIVQKHCIEDDHLQMRNRIHQGAHRNMKSDVRHQMFQTKGLLENTEPTSKTSNTYLLGENYSKHVRDKPYARRKQSTRSRMCAKMRRQHIRHTTYISNRKMNNVIDLKIHTTKATKKQCLHNNAMELYNSKEGNAFEANGMDSLQMSEYSLQHINKCSTIGKGINNFQELNVTDIDKSSEQDFIHKDFSTQNEMEVDDAFNFPSPCPVDQKQQETFEYEST